MTQTKTATSIVIEDARATTEGDGVDVNRLFPVLHGRMNYDPFVLFDHFDLKQGRGFPTHPHRGFEAITYLFEGGMQHIDNLGNESIVTKGGAQRFTAGRGIEHSEMPQGDTSGIQLWINLPKQLKKLPPDYQAVNQRDIPVIAFKGGVRHVIAGETSPMMLHTAIRYEEISLDQDAQYVINEADESQGFIYLLQGEVDLQGHSVRRHQVAYFSGTEDLTIKANKNSRFMLCMGFPHNEPIYQHGPYVD